MIEHLIFSNLLLGVEVYAFRRNSLIRRLEWERKLSNSQGVIPYRKSVGSDKYRAFILLGWTQSLEQGWVPPDNRGETDPTATRSPGLWLD